LPSVVRGPVAPRDEGAVEAKEKRGAAVRRRGQREFRAATGRKREACRVRAPRGDARDDRPGLRGPVGKTDLAGFPHTGPEREPPATPPKRTVGPELWCMEADAGSETKRLLRARGGPEAEGGGERIAADGDPAREVRPTIAIRGRAGSDDHGREEKE